MEKTTAEEALLSRKGGRSEFLLWAPATEPQKGVLKDCMSSLEPMGVLKETPMDDAPKETPMISKALPMESKETPMDDAKACCEETLMGTLMEPPMGTLKPSVLVRMKGCSTNSGSRSAAAQADWTSLQLLRKADGLAG